MFLGEKMQSGMVKNKAVVIFVISLFSFTLLQNVLSFSQLLRAHHIITTMHSSTARLP